MPEPVPPRPDLRARKKQAVRAELRRAVLDLALEHGLAEVSVEQIAERAGVSPRTFFNYFPAKEDAALMELFELPDGALAAVAAGTGPGVWSELGALFADDARRAVEHGLDLPRYWELHARESALSSRQMGRFAGFERGLTAAVRTRLGERPDAPALAAVMSGSCITAARVGLGTWGEAGWSGDVRAHVGAAFALLAPAFESPADPSPTA